MTLAKRPLKTRRRSPKRQKSPMTLSTMPKVTLLQKGTFKTSGMYSSTLGKTKKMEWDTTIDSSRDGAKMTFDVTKDGTKLSGDLNAVIHNHLDSLKGTIKKNGKVHHVDMKDINMLDQLSMQHAGLEMAMMLR
jgi:cytolysin (calcineurin-like family phosphatase)